MPDQRSPLLSDGVHAADGGHVVVIDGRVVFDGPVVARFSSESDAQRFYTAAIR